MIQKTENTLVWGLPTRLFHWLLAVSFASAYILSDFDDLLSFHFAFGALAGGLLAGRIVWGFAGPRYSRFKDFPISFSNISHFVSSIKSASFVGHNPLASLVMLGIMVVGTATALSGYMLNQSDIQTMPFSKDFTEELHEVLANLFLFLVILHLTGLMADLLLHQKNRAFFSIFTGRKNVNASPASINVYQKIVAVGWFALAFSLFVLARNLPVNRHQDDHEKIRQEQNDD